MTGKYYFNQLEPDVKEKFKSNTDKLNSVLDLSFQLKQEYVSFYIFIATAFSWKIQMKDTIIGLKLQAAK